MMVEDGNGTIKYMFISTIQPGIVEEAVEKLKQRILRSDIDDRSLPSQSQLATELGISRTAIREAMSILQAQGLLVIQRGKRPQILPVSNSSLSEQLKLFMARQGATFHQLMEVRLPIETEVARIAAQRATSDQLELLSLAIDRLKVAKRLDDQVNADREFHVGLARATHNPLFVSILESFHFGLQNSMQTTLGHVGLQHATGGHRAILEAVRQQQPDLAAKRMQWHLKQAVRDFKPKTRKESR
jgi:DNA-binding FadR family transcriptional regulator